MSQICPILHRITAVDKTDFCQDPWLIVRCRETGFVFLANPPDYSQLETEFAWEKTSTVERKRRETEEPVVSRVSALAKKAKSIISPKRDKIASVAFGVIQARNHSEPLSVFVIGWGCGNLMVCILSRFARLGRNVVPVGIEISKQLALLSQERVAALGGKVICANAIDGILQLERESIHLALLSSFLEHECQPLRLLQLLHSGLTPDGLVVLKLPNC